jgi:hypothetical protein
LTAAHQSQFFGTLPCAVDDGDLFDVPLLQTGDNCAGRSASTENEGTFRIYIPTRMTLIKIGKEADTIGIVTPELAILEPEGIGGFEASCPLGRLVKGEKGSLLVRDRDIDALKALF